ncbi:hypothetical protein PVK06_048226 [Gossypium arboreum]|uniref:Uncharacterized protein n=1 Tax=Gossypium arboreum TaxID=29729 RepID=A0ABR0MFG7_GOSAR|nr:hypothetical protein PVK06_048226 [Gossypium arboreum]
MAKVCWATFLQATKIELTSILNPSSHVNTSSTTSVGPPGQKYPKQKRGLGFWLGEKYTLGHKCTKSQLCQLFLETMDDAESEDFQYYPKVLEQLAQEKVQTQYPYILSMLCMAPKGQKPCQSQKLCGLLSTLGRWQ